VNSARQYFVLQWFVVSGDEFITGEGEIGSMTTTKSCGARLFGEGEF